MKLRAPPGCTGLSFEGRIYNVGSDGFIDVEERLVCVFLTQGFTPCVDAAAPDHLPDIYAMDRRALFALLREKGVPVRVPITNVALREAARRALSSPASSS